MERTAVVVLTIFDSIKFKSQVLGICALLGDIKFNKKKFHNLNLLSYIVTHTRDNRTCSTHGEMEMHKNILS